MRLSNFAFRLAYAYYEQYLMITETEQYLMLTFNVKNIKKEKGDPIHRNRS